jgi:transcription-repair coupling factor (superfamily II helicase)
LLPSSLKRSYQTETLDNSLVLERAEVLNRLNHTQHHYHLVVTYPEALCEQVMDKKSLTSNTYDVKTGDRFDLDFFVDFLNEHGFDRTDFVFEAGQYSIRGGIVDVFSFSNELPYRLVLDGEIIETIRSFDPNDQLSVKDMDHFSIVPNVQSAAQEHLMQTFFEYLPPSTIIWTKEPQLVTEMMSKGIQKAKKHYAGLAEDIKNGEGAILSPQLLYADEKSSHKIYNSLQALNGVKDLLHNPHTKLNLCRHHNRPLIKSFSCLLITSKTTASNNTIPSFLVTAAVR